MSPFSDATESPALPAAPARRRQWGAERRSEPLSIVHPTPSSRKIALGRLGIVVTVLAWVTYIVTTILRQFANNPDAGFRFQIEAVSYLIVVTFLTFSALMYLLARQGALYRFRDHRRVPRGELDRHFADHREGITVLVPSYAEEPAVVRATLWSAALQEFPDIRVVLLLDDPPQEDPLGGDEREPRPQVEAHLVAEDAAGAGPGAVRLVDAGVHHPGQQVTILLQRLLLVVLDSPGRRRARRRPRRPITTRRVRRTSSGTWPA